MFFFLCSEQRLFLSSPLKGKLFDYGIQCKTKTDWKCFLLARWLHAVVQGNQLVQHGEQLSEKEK